ncbi:Enoyl-CoA hydratase (plasmid) [Cupriavidus necator H850]|uniref:enoyl-CoA hydratase/isomerase family protein n=1 Tax=Cupriavidus necator TaxID=106590 RepID=UPI001892BC27|nr:enoyl-CoA hydratase/isomerase family protein [Cupriavidus necator]KAI3610275.1 Enoyl-CoA hydratase [Cupriavidus necator H850]
MTFNLIEIERVAPQIAVVRMKRDDKLNALNDELIHGLTDAAQTLREDASVKVVVLTGGMRAFSAGADIGTFDSIRKDPDVNRVRRATQWGVRMAESWESLPAITIAAVEGGAVGGGFGLALACDWRVFARNAYGYVPEVQLGLNYGWGTLQRLSALAGPARAKWISILCRKHGAEALASWNIVEQLAEPGQALESALVLAREVAALPALAAQIVKQSVNAHSTALARASSHADMDHMLLCLTDAEGQRARADFTATIGNRSKR